jgi:AhpD family alkylhydroperoxidase
MSRSKNLNRILPVDPKSVTGKTKQMFDNIQAKFGMVPNLFRVLGNAPAAFEAYVNFSAALADGTLDTKVQEQIGLTVADGNLCDYCLSAHIFMGGKIGLTPEEITDAIRARAANPKTDAILKLARGIIIQRGEISNSELERARGADLTDGEIVEIVANVVLNIFMNYLDHVARTVVDFPDVNRGP